MRWLETQGHHNSVLRTLRKIAIINKKSLPDLHYDTRPEVIYFDML